jgi:3-oxoacyl-[acyl-carrier protein] reductase
MDLGLRGKVALVAGASKGMGKAIALGFAREGASVGICARGEKELNATAEEIRKETGAEVLAFVADMTRSQDIRDFVAKSADGLGRIDIVVTNAGGPPFGEFMKFTDEDWEAAFRLNFLSALRLTREAVPHIRKGGAGRVINITSYGVKEPIQGLVLSNAIRTGVVGLAKTLSRELAKDNILVNTICPGRIDTERHRMLNVARAERTKRTLEEVHREMTGEIPLGRFGTAEEVANLVVFFGSERASYINGTTIQVDGGLVKTII